MNPHAECPSRRHTVPWSSIVTPDCDRAERPGPVSMIHVRLGGGDRVEKASLIRYAV